LNSLLPKREGSTMTKVSCLCPTFRRPKAVANAVACFLMQDFEDSELIVLDDEGDYIPGTIAERVKIVSIPFRFRTLPEKFNACAGLASIDSEYLIVWEDDDVYFPNHISNHVVVLSETADICVTSKLYDEKGDGGNIRVRDNSISFHSGWAYRRDFFDLIDGYKITPNLNFDQRTFQKFIDNGAELDSTPEASHVYTWLSSRYTNGSALHGDKVESGDWYAAAADLPYRDKPPEPIKLEPRLSEQSEKAYAELYPEALEKFLNKLKKSEFSY